MSMTPKEMARLLKKNGFVYIKNNNGSHQKFFNLIRKKSATSIGGGLLAD